MGRRTIDGKPRTKYLTIRIDDDRKKLLDQEKKRTGKPISQIVVELIDQLNSN